MIRVVASNRAEELLADLATRLRADQQRCGALVPVRVVVQGAAVERSVRLGVAARCGVAANLQTASLGRFAAGELAPDGAPSVAGADDLTAMALTLLLDDAFLDDADLAPVRAYLASARSRDAADVRRVQLASRLGRLFEQYSHGRGDMLAQWARGPTHRDGPYAEPERWQRRTWLAMFGEAGLGRARGLVPLHEAVASYAPPPATEPAPAVHVFGFAHFAPVFHDLFARLASARDVVVYSLSPCEGFWEDFDPRDPAPLLLWGRPGREHVRALDAASGFDHDDRFVEPPGATLLAQIQRDLLHRAPARESVDSGFAFENDESLVVLEHASVRRELEAVASEIAHLLERDETLRFDDVAVLVPEGDAAYLAHLPAVFREAHDIPCQMHDLAPAGDGRVAEAIDLLLALPFGRFTRQELLRLVVHPAVVARFGGVDPERWVGWCEALGVVHGADRADHEETYIERDILNWDQGLRRLALGAFMAGDASGDRRPVEIGGEAYAPCEVLASELGDAAALGLLVRSLVADARFARAAELPMRDWAAFLCEAVATYLAAPSDAEAEALVEATRRLHALGEVDLGGRRVPYRIASELARARLASAGGRRGSEGVVVSHAGALRPAAFRVVFACGLGEGRFPAADADDSLDLRRAERRPGDVSARERDKYAFLELLLDARERLYLSYVSRDPLTGDPVAPSSVVQELLHALSRGYVRDASALRRRHPLRRWDEAYFPDLFPGCTRAAPLATMALPEARAEAKALAARRDLEARGARVDRDRVEAWAAVDEGWARLADHLRIARVPAPEPGRDRRLVVPIYALVKFLEFPMQGWARLRLGMDETEEEDVLAREDEPFETDRRDETLLLRAAFFEAAAGGVSVERAYEATARDRERRGQGPSGVFAAAEKTEHLRTLEVWRSELESRAVSLDAIEVHRFGRAGEHSRADRVHAALALDVDVADAAGVARVVRVEVSGRTLPIAAGVTSLTLSKRMQEGKDDWAHAERRRVALRALVDRAVLAASGVSGGGPGASLQVIATPEAPVTQPIELGAMSRGDATVWLRGLLRELLGGPHAYFLPCEAIFVHRRRAAPASLGAALEEARGRLQRDGPPALRSAYGPVLRPHDYPAPPEADAREAAERRLGPIFAATEDAP